MINPGSRIGGGRPAYLLKGVVPQWDLEEIYKGRLQFMVIQLLGLALVFLFPQIALWVLAVI